MDRRKAEIEEKRAKLAELKRARVERKKGLSNASKLPVDGVGFAEMRDRRLTRLIRARQYRIM